MSALIQTSFANEATAYWATENQLLTLSQAIANLSSDIQNWSTYPAVSTIDASSNAITNVLSLQLDDQILTALSGELLLNGVPIATISGISNVSDWALYPAIANVDANNFAISNVSGFELDGQQISAVGNTILVNGQNQTSNWANYNATATVNMSGFNVEGGNAAKFQAVLSPNVAIQSISDPINHFVELTTDPSGTQLLVEGIPVVTTLTQNTSQWSTFPAVSVLNMSGFGISNTPSVSISGTTQNVVLTAAGTQLLVDGQPVFTGVLPPSDTSNWANYPAVNNVNMSGFALTSGSSNGLDLSLGGRDVYIQTGGAGSCNCYIKGNVESGSITCKGVISQSNAGSGCNFFQSAVQVGVNGILPTDKLGQVIVYGVNTPALTSALYVQGGTTLDGGGTVHGITIGTQPVAGINTVRIDVLPVGILLTSPTFITMNGLGAANIAMGGAIALAAGSYVTLEHGAGLGQNGIFLQNTARDGQCKVIMTGGGTFYNATSVQSSNIINPNGVQFWDGVYNPSGGGAPIAPLNFGRAVVDISSAGCYLANLTGGDLPATKNSNSVFIGNMLNLTTTGATSTIAIGDNSGMAGQGSNAIAIGKTAGTSNQESNAIAIGYLAGNASQGEISIAIGTNAGQSNQGFGGLAIGYEAGQSNQGSGAVAIGGSAGATGQGQNTVAVGFLAGETSQETGAVAIGPGAGNINQGTSAVAVGTSAGADTQGDRSIAIGRLAGTTGQSGEAIAIGFEAGSVSQGIQTIALGVGAGSNTQGSDAIAIGYTAGNFGQGAASIAVGSNAGRNLMKPFAIAIGHEAGKLNAGVDSIALGHAAGGINHGAQSIYIGSVANADESNAVGAGTIVLNATAAKLAAPTGNNSFYVDPVRSIGSLTPGYNLMGYSISSKEVVSAGALSTLSVENVISNTQGITYDTGLLTTIVNGIFQAQSTSKFVGTATFDSNIIVTGSAAFTAQATFQNSMKISNVVSASYANMIVYDGSANIGYTPIGTTIVAAPSFVYYVSTNGRVGASGSITDPLSTINAALAKLASAGPVDPPGMTIYVATGAYTEDVVVPISLTLPAVSIIGMADDTDDSKRVQIRGSITINNTEASFVNTVNTVVINNIAVFAKNASTSAVTITGRGMRVYLKNGLYTQQTASATASLISLASSVAPPSNLTNQLVIDNCSLSMSSATASGHIVNVTSGQIFSINNSDLTNRGTGSAVNMAAGAFSGANNSRFNTLGAVMTIIQSAAGLTSLVGCTMSGRASPSVALITLGTNATLNLNESIVQNLDTTTEVNNTSRYIYTTSATGNLIVAIRSNITNSRAAVTQITPFQAAVPAASQLLYFANIYTNLTATLVGNLPAQGGANWNAVRQFNTDTYTQQIQVTATSASAIVLSPTIRGRTIILTGTTTQAFSTAQLGAADVGFFVLVHNGNGAGGGDINMTGMSGTAIIHNRTLVANGGDVYLYWTGAALVGY